MQCFSDNSHLFFNEWMCHGQLQIVICVLNELSRWSIIIKCNCLIALSIFRNKFKFSFTWFRLIRLVDGLLTNVLPHFMCDSLHITWSIEEDPLHLNHWACSTAFPQSRPLRHRNKTFPFDWVAWISKCSRFVKLCLYSVLWRIWSLDPRRKVTTGTLARVRILRLNKRSLGGLQIGHGGHIRVKLPPLRTLLRWGCEIPVHLHVRIETDFERPLICLGRVEYFF